MRCIWINVYYLDRRDNEKFTVVSAILTNSSSALAIDLKRISSKVKWKWYPPRLVNDMITWGHNHFIGLLRGLSHQLCNLIYNIHGGISVCSNSLQRLTIKIYLNIIPPNFQNSFITLIVTNYMVNVSISPLWGIWVVLQ